MMHMNVRRMIGKRPYVFQFLGEDLHEVVMESQHIGFPDVTKCGLCGSEDLELRAFVTEKDKYRYVKIRCQDCRGSLTLGQTKKDATYFLRRKKESNALDWVPYTEKVGSRKDEEET